MTEQEYIDATNLSKVRTMLTILRDTLPIRPEEEILHREIKKDLRAWIEVLEVIVRCDPLT